MVKFSIRVQLVIDPEKLGISITDESGASRSWLYSATYPRSRTFPLSDLSIGYGLENSRARDLSTFVLSTGRTNVEKISGFTNLFRLVSGNMSGQWREQAACRH